MLSRPRSVLLALAGAATFLIATTPAAAVTELEAISASPDTTALFGALETRDQDVFVDDLQGMLAPVDLGPLPERVAVDAFHDDGGGTVLFSLDGWGDLGGLVVTPGDVVAWDGTSHTRIFNSGGAGVPAGANLDALTVDGDDLLLSYDVTIELGGSVYADDDLVRWDGSAFSLAFAGGAAGVPVSADLDAAHRLDDGNLLLSFDTGGLAGGVTFADEDVLEHDPADGTWELAYNGSAAHPAWAAADLDALSVGEPPLVVEIPTLSTMALLFFAFSLAAAGLILRRRTLNHQYARFQGGDR